MSNFNPEVSLNHKREIVNQNIMATVKGSGNTCIHGPAGHGKTSLVQGILKEAGVDYVPFALHNAPLALARSLYENRTALILIDDTSHSRNSLIQTLFKCVLAPDPRTGKRTIRINVSDAILKREGLPGREFDFEGKVIILTNQYDSDESPHAQALASRLLAYHYALTFEEKKYLINQFAKVPDRYGIEPIQMTALIEYLNQHLHPGCTGFDLRLFEKAVAIMKGSPSSWETGVANLVEADPQYSLICTIIDMCDAASLPKADRVQVFTRLTGLSRSSYFDLCKRLEITKGCDSGVRQMVDDNLRAAIEAVLPKSPGPSQRRGRKSKNPAQLAITQASSGEGNGPGGQYEGKVQS